VSTLHLLVDVRAIQNVRDLHCWPVHCNVRRLIEQLTGHVPQLEDVEALLGTNRNAYDLILRVGRNKPKNGCRRISLEGLCRVGLGDLDTVTTTVNIAAMLPQWQIRVTHQEEHPSQEVCVGNGLEGAPERGKVVKRPHPLVALWPPIRIRCAVVVQSPRSRRE